MQKVYRQREVITIANGTSAGIYTKNVSLAKDYPNLRGIMVQQITSGGLTNIGFGIRDANSGNVIEDINDSRNWIADTGVGHSDREKTFNYRAGGTTLQIQIETLGTTNAEARYEFVFILEKENNTAEMGRF